MDELTIGLLRRLARLRGWTLALVAAGAFLLGWVAPVAERVDLVTLASLLAAWLGVAWASGDRESAFMRSVLAAPTARRAWLATYLKLIPLMASLVCFLALLSRNVHLALGAAALVLTYGWIVAAVGLWMLLHAGRPRETMWMGGGALALAVFTVAPDLSLRSGWAWHPLALLKSTLHQALTGPHGSSPMGSFVDALREPALQGILPSLVLSLIAWRWSLRTLDRLEMLPNME